MSKERKVLIWEAAYGNKKDELKELLKSATTADLQYEQKYGGDMQTALMVAALWGYRETVDMLIKAKSDVNRKSSKNGQTALMWAAKYGKTECVQLLLSAGADLNIPNKDGKTVADLAKIEDIRALIHTHVKSSAPPQSAPTAESLHSIPSPSPPSAPTTESIPSIPSPSPPSAPTEVKSADQNTHSPNPSLHSTNSTKEHTEQQQVVDTASIQAFNSNVTDIMRTNADLCATMAKVIAHDRVLQVLVSKEKECPSLFWFYPKNVSLRHWLSNPTKCLFQDTLMMVVVCPVTLCVVECGPKGVGWEVSMPKKWVKEWAPAILLSIYVMQAAALAGRVVGIPLPPLPSTRDMKEAMGLKSMLADVFRKGENQANLQDSLNAFKDITEKAMDAKSPEVRALRDGLRLSQGFKSEGGSDAVDSGLPASLPMKLVGDAYKSIHTFLTTGDNAKLGKLEDQLRGRMERVMAVNGDVEWVSVEGRDVWMQKHSALQTEARISSAAAATSTTTTTSTTAVVYSQVPSSPASPSAVADSVSVSWLSARLRERGLVEAQISLCEKVLVEEDGLSTEEIFALDNEFSKAYLSTKGITVRGTVIVLLSLHDKLRAQYCPIPSPPPLPPQLPVSGIKSCADIPSAAVFSEDKIASFIRNMERMEALTKEVDKMRKKEAAASAVAGKSSGGGGVGGGRGGQALMQAQCTEVNPRTGQPYTMDELLEQIKQLQIALARNSADIANVASTAQVGLEYLGAPTAAALSTPTTHPAGEEGSEQSYAKGKGLF
mmetsp:Transcript_13067/g.26441  ORF Transcript_13067/g.26441 Transcript_13067/m.26441 type:complete len:775 (-) Transcript_13067:49-2373(-)